jgi:DNA (cytosine-5)-methyltransferase 1
MGVSAYYNENDPAAAAWLRELIKAGEIADGVVDDRGVEEVTAHDVRGFTQCHFFAGIGAWSLALRRGGWDDERPVWTASLPCQPFSNAGKREGVEDRRHLWPVFFRLMLAGKCPFVPVLGEQVSGRGGLEWFDLVSADLEGEGYAVGATDTCAAGFGAPHLRQRLYWLADAQIDRQHIEPGKRGEPKGAGLVGIDQPDDGVGAGGLADADGGHVGQGRKQRSGEQRQQPEDGGADGLGLADSGGSWTRREAAAFMGRGDTPVAAGGGDRPGPVNGHWAAADWLPCRDNKWRPVEPGAFPLASGVAARVGRLRGYGNSLCVPQAEAFVRAAIDALW